MDSQFRRQILSTVRRYSKDVVLSMRRLIDYEIDQTIGLDSIDISSYNVYHSINVILPME